jgi:hypothetical protein
MSSDEKLTDELLKYTRKSVAFSNKIPADLKFYTSSYKECTSVVEECQKKIIGAINSLLNAAKDDYIEESIGFVDSEDLVDNYNAVWVDVLDSIFERVNCNLDTLKKKPATSSALVSPIGNSSGSSGDNFAVKLSGNNLQQVNSTVKGDATKGAGKNIAKPQLAFKDQIDNSDEPFVPLIGVKLNAQKPLKLELVDNDLPVHVTTHMESLGKAVPRKRYLLSICDNYLNWLHD